MPPVISGVALLACYPAFEGKVDLSVVTKTDPHQSEWSFVRAK